MAADINDKITKTFNAGNPRVATVTQSRTSGAGTLDCDNLAGWPDSAETAVHFSTYKIDTSNAVIPNTQIDWKGIVTGNSIGSMTRLAGAADAGHDIGDIVEMNPTASWADDLATALLVKHDPEGNFLAGAVETNDIDDEAVTEAKLDDSAVSTNKIQDGAVTSPKLTQAFVKGRQQITTTNTDEEGYLMQWGNIATPNFTSAPSFQSVTVTFPTAFTSTPWITLSGSHSSGSIDDITVSISAVSNTSVTFRGRVGVHGSNSAIMIRWIAVGPV